MFDWLVEFFSAYPYLGVALIFLICGLGFPLPEEIVLVSAGYVCFKGLADFPTMMAACAGAILLGDIIPFALGRWLGLPLLRVKPMRMIITRQRLARFNRWFRRRGNLVIFFSRFVAGIRVVAYFTAGTMKMSWWRFITLDMLGIAMIVPLFVYVGFAFGSTIDDAIAKLKTVERGILITLLSVGAIVGLWYWMRWRRRQRALVGQPTETYVEPTEPVANAREESRGDGADDRISDSSE